VILEDSLISEIEAFALRLSMIPTYNKEQEYARDIVRHGYKYHRVFDPVYIGGRFMQGGFRTEEIPPLDPVETIALSPSQLKKGKRLWTITI